MRQARDNIEKILYKFYRQGLVAAFEDAEKTTVGQLPPSGYVVRLDSSLVWELRVEDEHSAEHQRAQSEFVQHIASACVDVDRRDSRI